MRDSLEHRGPDDAGAYLSPGIALGSRRLAIQDLSPRGHMPLVSRDGRYRIAYNGEIYNFRTLRRQLESRGASFVSDSDTEVLVEGYALEGPSFLERCNGMFALAIWDGQDHSLFLARDRLGVKPLYLGELGSTLLFASEEKALFAAGVDPEFDRSRLGELLCFRYVAGSRTPFKRVTRLRPGHFLRWRDGQVSVQRWWKLADRADEVRSGIPPGVTSWFRDRFDDSVRLRRISDVPVGVMASGGLDSSSVVAAASLQSGGGIHAFTVGFEEPGFDETPLAREVADHYSATLHERRVSASELPELLDAATWYHDEPLAHGNDAHMLALARLAKPVVTVLLSGEGADETLNGYVRYQPLRAPGLLALARPLLARLTDRRLPGRLRKVGRFAAMGDISDFMLFNAADVLPADLSELLPDAGVELSERRRVLDEARLAHPGEPLRQVMYLDQHTFLSSLLDRNDRMTMGASIECRVPFLDYRLVEGLASLSSQQLLRGAQRKTILREAFRDRLPRSIQQARKWGFGVPWRRYLDSTGPLRERLESLPSSDFLKGAGLEARGINHLLTRFFRGDPTAEALCKELLMLRTWWDTYLPRARRLARGVS